MRRFDALLLGGGVVALLGVSLLWAGVAPAEPSESVEQFTIPAGPEWYYVVQYYADAGIHFTVQFTVPSGGTVDAHLFDGNQFEEYSQTLAGNGLASASGASGTFDVFVPANGDYSLTFDHGAGYEGQAQDVRATIRIGSVAVVPFLVVVGIALFVAGIVLAAAGWNLKRKAQPSGSVPPKPIDVVVFSPKPPADVAFFGERRPPGS